MSYEMDWAQIQWRTVVLLVLNLIFSHFNQNSVSQTTFFIIVFEND